MSGAEERAKRDPFTAFLPDLHAEQEQDGFVRDLPSLRTPQRQSVLELLTARGPVPPGFQVGEEKIGGQSFVTVACNGHKLLALPSPDGWRFVVAFFDVARKMAREHRIGIAAEMLCMAPAELAAALERNGDKP